MKTLSLKVLGCAAAVALLTNARAQDDVQAVPPPDTNVQSTDTAPAQQQTAPPVVILQVPAEGATNGGENNDQQPDNGPGAQSQTIENNQPNQQYRYNQGGQNQGGQNRFNNGGLNNDRGGRNRGNFGNRGDANSQRGGINSVPVGEPSNFLPPTTGGTNGTDGLILNFRDTQIDQVLNYLSDAAGFIIELDTHVSGTVSVWSARPVSKNDAVTILNSALAKNGYAVIQAGRILRVMSKEDALHEVPVIVNGDPDQIPQTGDTVTQIIPVRYVSARQLISDLSLLTPSTSTIIANDAGNSIIITDTQQNIHHLAELIKAIDGSAEDVTEVKVFHLQYHDPVEVAALLTSIFVDQSGQNGGQSAPVRFGGLGGLAAAFGGGGRGGFGGGGFGGGRGGGGGLAQFFGGGAGGRGGQGGQQGGNQGSVRPRAKVVAVADQRMQSVLVTAPKDVMAQVEEVVAEVDKESPKVAQVTVVPLVNADPTVVLKALQDFQANNGRSSSTANQNSIFTTRAAGALNSTSSGFGTSSSGFGGGGGGSGIGGGGFGGGGGGGGFRGGGQ
jgi:hypothetical protein